MNKDMNNIKSFCGLKCYFVSGYASRISEGNASKLLKSALK
jgi:hypothetical protein